MDVTRRVLVQFAHDTRHKDHELESEPQIHLLCQKLLATQAPIVPQEQWSHVYHYVSDDLDRLNFRSEPGFRPSDWAQHKEIPLQVYQTLLKDVKVSRMCQEGDATYCDFINAIQPLPESAREEDEPVLFFIHGARHKNLRALLEDMYPNDNINELYQRMMEYRVHHLEDPLQTVRDVGFMIVNLNIPVANELYLYDTPEEEHDHPAAQEAPVQGHQMKLKPVTDDAVAWTDAHERELRTNPVMMQYRKQSRLASHFSSRKALKQYLILAIANKQVATNNLPSNALGRQQTHDQLPDTVQVTDSHEDWMQALSILDHYPAQQVNAIVKDPQAQYLYNVLASTMKRDDLEDLSTRDFVQLWVTAHSGKGWEQRWSDQDIGGSLKRAVQKYLARYAEPSQGLVQFLAQGPQ